MRTYAEINRENQQLRENLQLTETMLETERENRKVLEEKNSQLIEFIDHSLNNPFADEKEILLLVKRKIEGKPEQETGVDHEEKRDK